MFLTFPSQKIVITDFQLIYDTDNFIQLDFYAEGLKKEPLLYHQDLYLDRISYGFLKGDLSKHIKNEESFYEYLKRKEWVDKTSIDMIKSIVKLHRFNRIIEKELFENKISYSLWEEYFSIIAKVLSFKRFSDECKPISFSADKQVFEETIGKIRFPSHIYLFYQKFNNLKENPTNENIRKFIYRYGFLYDFNIKPTIFENEIIILEKLNSTALNEKKTNTKKREIAKTFDIQLLKRLSWYEEWRHYYQARVLRNYRKAFEILNLDIYRTGIDDFHKTLKERKMI